MLMFDVYPSERHRELRRDVEPDEVGVQEREAIRRAGESGAR